MSNIEQDNEQAAARTEEAASPIYYGWVIVATCFVIIGLVSPVIASFSVFYVAVLQDYQWSRSSITLAFSIHLVVGGLASPLAGHLIDRFGPRRVMPIGAVLTAASLMWLSQATKLWHFYIAFGIVAAIGSVMLHIVPLTTIISNWFVRNRRTAIGIVSAGSGVGQLSLPLLQYLISEIGWRYSYLLLGAAILIVPTLLIQLFLHSHPADRGLSAEDEMMPRRKRQVVEVVVQADGDVLERKRGLVRKGEVVILDREWAEKDWTIGKAVKTFRFWALTLVIAMFASGFFLISTHLVAYLIDKGYSPVMAATVTGLQGLINVLGKFVGGVLCDRIGREKTLTLSVVTFIACIILLNVGGIIYSPLTIYVFTIFYGMGYGMSLPALISSAADLFQGKHFGAVLGVMIFGGFAFGALSAWLGGYFFDLTQAYQVNFWVAGLAMVVSGVLIWKARPSRVRLVVSQAS